MTVPKMTGPALFSAILDAIIAEPQRWAQHSWHATRKTVNSKEVFCDVGSSQAFECGTAHCIAGWAMVLAFDRAEDSSAYGGLFDPSDQARRLLGLDTFTADRMFRTNAASETIIDLAVDNGLISSNDPRIPAFMALTPADR